MQQYPNYSYKPLEYPYLKKLSSIPNRYHIYSAINIVFLSWSTYHILHLYKEWIYNRPYWKKRREEKIIDKQSYELLIQANHPMRKSMIKSFSQF